MLPSHPQLPRVINWLERVRRGKHLPNFWMSPAFICEKLAQNEWQWQGEPGLMESGEWVFPPIDEDGSIHPVETPIWADFPRLEEIVPGESPAPELPSRVLDRQYIFVPIDVLLFKHSHHSFKDNVRKFDRKYCKDIVTLNLEGSLALEPDQVEERINLLVKWLEPRRDLVQDDQMMQAYLSQDLPHVYSQHFYLKHQLIGVNIFEHYGSWNWFRYNFTDPAFPLLNEWTRYQMYQFLSGRMGIHMAQVNDGGDLDNQGLARFKQRLGPSQVLYVHSWIRKEDNGEQNGNPGEVSSRSA